MQAAGFTSSSYRLHGSARLSRCTLEARVAAAYSRSARRAYTHDRAQQTATSPTTDELDSMPSHILAQLLRQSLAQQLAAKEKMQEAEEQLLQWHRNRYVIDLPVSQGRIDEEQHIHAIAIAAKWEPVKSPRDHAGRQADRPSDAQEQTLLYDAIEEQFVLCPGQSEGSSRAELWLRQQQPGGGYRGSIRAMWQVISSALLLYRLHCLFIVPPVQKQDQYKSVWGVTLLHKDSGRLLQLGEHKGAAKWWADLYDPDPSGFTADVLELVNLLCDPECPHTYDGCVAGCVAS